MKVIIEVTDKPKENDVLIFADGKWKTLNKDVFFFQRDKNIQALTEELNNIKDGLKKVDAKLEEYHKILQTLTKGE